MTDGSPPRVTTEGRRLRVVYLDHVAILSGGEIALLRLLDTLDEVDAHVILAADGPLVERLRSAGVSVEVLPMRERTRDLRKDRVSPRRLPISALVDTASYTFRLARRLRAIKPDLVHTNTLKSGVYGSLAARLARVPVVWHVRDRIAADYLGRPAATLLRAMIANVPQGVIANSEATRATLQRPRADTRVIYAVVYAVIHDPVTVDSLRSRIERPYGGPFVVGMVGRIARWKGQHVFLAAFAQAFGDGSETAVLVGEAMFGEADETYAVELRELARRLGIADRVEFRGFREDVWAELAGMDIFVHASVTAEPFGQVVVEAMLAGVPVIAAAGGGPSEILTDGVDGVLYPAGNVDRLAAALRRAREDDALRDRLSANARARATRLSPQAAAPNVMALYKRVLDAATAEHHP